jgi:uncharacterized protein (TIGR02246 family)
MTFSSTSRRVAISFAALAFTWTASSAAYADALADANAVTGAFSKAFAACDVPAVVAMYEDNATIIWPGQGQFGTGKDAIEKIVKENCSAPSQHSLAEVSSDARQVGKDYIIHTGQLDDTTAGPDGKRVILRIRVSELLHKSGGQWRYVVDHASAGLPPPPSGDGAKTP